MEPQKGLSSRPWREEQSRRRLSPQQQRKQNRDESERLLPRHEEPSAAFARSYGTYRHGTGVIGRRSLSSLVEPQPEEDIPGAQCYTQHLARTRSTLNVTFMSFVLATVPYGLSTTLIYPLTGGGSATIIWGWIVVCLMMTCVAASLGEITSVYPLAGGVYYQTFMLAPRPSRKPLAWLCGWCFVLGNIIITLSVNFGTSLLLIGCINIFQTSSATDPTTTTGIFQPKPYQTYLIFLAITLLCTSISIFTNKHLHHLDTAAVIWTFIGTIAIIISILTIAAEGRRPASWVFGSFEVLSGWKPPGWAFCIGLLHGAYATSATGMVVSMCEEVKEPATQVPQALIGATVLNMVCGLVFLIPLCFVMPDLAAIANDPSGQPLPAILRAAIGNTAGAFTLTVPIIILGILCGTQCSTATARCTWAFARDGAIPGSRRLRLDALNENFGLPLNAMLLSLVIQASLGLIYLGSSNAFHAFNGSGVIFLTLSYVMPIAISVFGGRRKLATAKFHLGKLGWVANAVSIAWCAFAIPLFCMPSALPVTTSSMNYASCVFVGSLIIAGGWYSVAGKHHYDGPRMVVEPAEATPPRNVKRDVSRR